MKKIVAFVLFCSTMLSCPAGLIRQRLEDLAPLATGQYDVQGLNIVPHDARISLSWSNPDPSICETYKILLTDSSGRTVFQDDSVAVSTVAYDITTGIVSGTTYTLTLSAYDAQLDFFSPGRRTTVTPGVVFVDPNAGRNGTGLNWQDSFNDLQAAIVYAADQTIPEIHVATGTLVPKSNPSGFDSNSTAPEYKHFRPSGNVAIVGGYSIPNNTVTGQTTLSGDQSGSYSYHVLYNDAVDESYVMENFIIRDGRATPPDIHGYGGGVCLNSGSAIFRNCVFTQNQALFGGSAVHGTVNCTLTLEDCTVSFNSPSPGGAPTSALAALDSTLTITGSNFHDNSADVSGGVYSNRTLAQLNNCVFTNNYGTANYSAGGAYQATGPAPVNLVDCEFRGNSAKTGGAVYFSGVSRGLIQGCVFEDNGGNHESLDCLDGGAIAFMLVGRTPITGNVFSHNSSLNQGGALYFSDADEAQSISNNVFLNNSASDGAAIYNRDFPVDIRFCTFVSRGESNRPYAVSLEYCTGNIIQNCVYSSDNPANLFFRNRTAGSADSVIYSLCNQPSVCITSVGTVDQTGMVFSTDPIFVRVSDPDGVDNAFGTLDDGLRPKSSSPVVDKVAETEILYDTYPFDVTGRPRWKYSNGSTGGPADWGAYEYSNDL